MYYCIHLSYIYTVFIAHEGFPPLSSSLHVEEKHFFSQKIRESAYQPKEFFVNKVQGHFTSFEKITLSTVFKRIIKR